MIQNRLAHLRRGHRLQQERVYYRFERGYFVDESARCFEVAVEPSFYDFDLVGEVEGSGTESGRVEGGFFEANGSVRM